MVRTFTPIVAGVAEMNYKVFLTYNVIGAFLWAFTVPILGYLLGNVVPDIERYIIPLIILIVGVSFLPVATDVVRKRFLK